MSAPSLLSGPVKRTDWKRSRRVSLNEQGQERQHFLLSAAAVTLSEKQIARMTEAEAYSALEAIRFAEHGGKPFCPYCDTTGAYRMTINRRTKAGIKPTVLYKCRHSECRKQFSITSCTTLSGRKMEVRDILYALMVFTDAASGEAALRIRRAVGCSYKAAFVLEGKMREAIALSRDPRPLEGTIEVDGTTIGGHFRKGRLKARGKETRAGEGSREQSVVALRERRPEGRSRVGVFGHELRYRDEISGQDFIRDNVVFDSTMVSDEGFSLAYIGPHKTVKHKEGYLINGVHTNGVEGLFARLKRAENGVHYRMTGTYVDLYAEEQSWREDYRRKSNGEQWNMLTHAVTHAPASKRWKGYWQRWEGEGVRRRRRTPVEKTEPRSSAAAEALAIGRPA